MQENNGLLISSEVAMEAMRLLNDAGIEIPFPQRDLHVRSIDPTLTGLLPSSQSRNIAGEDESSFDSLPPARKITRTVGD
jgi:small-conductance mechanosensitive channel